MKNDLETLKDPNNSSDKLSKYVTCSTATKEDWKVSYFVNYKISSTNEKINKDDFNKD